ncbi:MAG TPA: TonB family protein [Longimicrobiaceae bacterium]|nr:TonB family protein [Longimicrobiaceae bacterium]
MFQKLDRKKRGFWSPTTIVVSVGLHLLLGLGVWKAGLGQEMAKRKKEELVDFMEIEENKPKEPEAPKPEPPPPPPPEPEAPPPVAKGFQELIPPQEPPKEIPKVDLTQTATKAEDFSGVGTAGGVSTGVEGGQAQDASDRETPANEGTYEMSAVEELPELSNRSDVARQISRNYPPLLRDAGVTGQVTIRMRVLEDGRVDPGSISVENASHDQFGDAARRVVERMRFRPAKVGGRAVKVWVTLPVTFQLQT